MYISVFVPFTFHLILLLNMTSHFHLRVTRKWTKEDFRSNRLGRVILDTAVLASWLMRVGTQKQNALSLRDISIGHHFPWRIKVSRYCMEPVFSTRKFIVPLSNYFFFFNWRIIAWYNIVMVSALHLHESAIGIHMPLPLEPLSHLPPHPTPLGGTRAPALGSLHHTANFHWLSLLHLEIYMF